MHRCPPGAGEGALEELRADGDAGGQHGLAGLGAGPAGVAHVRLHRGVAYPGESVREVLEVAADDAPTQGPEHAPEPGMVCVRGSLYGSSEFNAGGQNPSLGLLLSASRILLLNGGAQPSHSPHRLHKIYSHLAKWGSRGLKLVGPPGTTVRETGGPLMGRRPL